MAKQQRSSLTEVADEPESRLEAVKSFGGKEKEDEPRWVTPSIQLEPEQLHLLRAVATTRANQRGKGRVQISEVIRTLIEDNRAALEAEAERQKGTAA